MTGDELTVTGKTLGENVDKWMVERGHSWEGQQIIRPLNNPIKETGHIRYALLDAVWREQPRLNLHRSCSIESSRVTWLPVDP